MPTAVPTATSQPTNQPTNHLHLHFILNVLLLNVKELELLLQCLVLDIPIMRDSMTHDPWFMTKHHDHDHVHDP